MRYAPRPIARIEHVVDCVLPCVQWWNMVRPTATEPVLRVVTNGGLESGRSMTAGYVVRAPEDVDPASVVDPQLSLSKVSCVGSESLADLQPRVFCRANVNITARAGLNERSRWSDGHYLYQVYDLKVVNMGGRLITDARISLALAPEAELLQWWEVNRLGASSSVFHPSNPIRVDSALTGGVIERVPLSALGNHQPIRAQVDSISCV